VITFYLCYAAVSSGPYLVLHDVRPSVRPLRASDFIETGKTYINF